MIDDKECVVPQPAVYHAVPDCVKLFPIMALVYPRKRAEEHEV
ncbi:MAG: hypothetical protein ACOYXU_06795 [Nitrospirota bacterium]